MTLFDGRPLAARLPRLSLHPLGVDRASRACGPRCRAPTLPHMKQFAPIILLVVAVALGAFATYEYQQAEHFRALAAQMDKDAAGAREQMDNDAADLRKLKDQTHNQKVAVEQLETRNKELANGAATGAAKPAGETAGAAGESGKDESGGFMKGFAKMFSDPKMKDAMRAQQVASVNMMYGDLAKELGLAPDVARQVLALLGERQADLVTASMAAMSKDGKNLAEGGKETEAAKTAYNQ